MHVAWCLRTTGRLVPGRVPARVAPVRSRPLRRPGIACPAGRRDSARPARNRRRPAEAAAETEALGYGALWLSEGLVRDPFMEAAALLGATRSLVVGTSIAVIWGRHPRVIRSQTRALLDAHPGRFVLGLGTSHARMVEGVLGLRYERPLTTGYADGACAEHARLRERPAELTA
ncbi:LLM class flavin-dependent oxidoreductase [Actinomadura sp. LOL_016]|uniref:LLM class flavin-dependent oxidoreductase n=1 Tax=unclassified Actinomadura TaxID=2626254 RepID=UPI003A80858D